VLLTYFLLHFQNNPVGKSSIKYGDFISHLVSIDRRFSPIMRSGNLAHRSCGSCPLFMRWSGGRCRPIFGLLLVAVGLGLAALLIPDMIGDGAWLTDVVCRGSSSLFGLSPRGAEIPVVKAVLALAILVHLHGSDGSACAVRGL
jgi:hypothetical protein